MMPRFLWICLGGAAGTGARYLMSGWAQRLGGSFPYGTLFVNVLGSFLLGVLMQVSLTTGLLSPTLRLALTTGALGGFTTYSTFNYETLQYFQGGAWLFGFLNILTTVIGCLIAGAFGLFAARWALGN
jgi:CrcB protein